MAGISISLFDLNECETVVENLISYELCEDCDAPCDSLSLTFFSKKVLDEIYRVEASVDGKRVFTGFADTQREQISDNGFVCFIYARSSACLLTDSEAKPFTYNSPSALGLFKANCDGFGFSYEAGNIYCENQYQVSKGTSKFSALQDFVYGVTGDRIRIDCNNALTLMKTKNSRTLKGGVIGIKRVINRANALEKINYKLNSDKDYIYCRESAFMKKRKIRSRVMKNLAYVEDWRRDKVLSSVMKSKNSEYHTYTIIVSGFEKIGLMDEVRCFDSFFGNICGIVYSVVHSQSGGVEQTCIKARVPFDLEEMTYVDE